MDREDITRMAKEAHLEALSQGKGMHVWHGDAFMSDVQDFCVRFAALVAAAEREACAAVCCDMIDAEYKTGKVDHNEMAWTQACANAIRARGDQ